MRNCPTVLINSSFPRLSLQSKKIIQSKQFWIQKFQIKPFTRTNAKSQTLICYFKLFYKTYFTTFDLQYAYGQLNLHAETARPCNFNIVSVDMTGAYQFKTGFYGWTDMPAEFQKALVCTLTRPKNTFCFLDDILIVSRVRLENQLDLVRKCLIKLDEENLRINLAKCHFAKGRIEQLGHRILQSGITLLSNKTAAIQQPTSPTNLQKAAIFKRSVQHLCNLIPNLSQLCYLFDRY